MQRTSYALSLSLALFALALSWASPVHAQTTLDTPLWTVGPADANWMTTNSTERGGAYNPATDHILVASAREGGATPSIIVIDAADGTTLSSLDMTGVTGGTFTLSQVAVTTDGQIFASNFTRDAAATDADAGPAKIYYWSAEDAVPVEVYSGDPSSGDTEADSRRFGEGLGVSGTGTDVMVYLSSDRNVQLAMFTWDGTALGTPTLITLTADTDDYDGASDGIAAVPGSDNALWVNGLDEPISQISTTDGSLITRVSEDLVSFSYDALAVAEIDDRTLLAAGPGNAAGQDEQIFRVVDVTDPAAKSLAYVTESVGALTSNETRSGFVAFDTARDNLIVFSTNNALASYPLNAAAADFEATLAGYNEVGPVMTDATGDVMVTLTGNMLTVSGTFSDLSSDLMDVAGTPAHIHLGGPGENGPVVIKLDVNADGDGGSFDASENTFDLSALTYPDGVDMDAVVSAIGSGGAYVNVHTENFPAGEIRGQILASPNVAPAAASILTPDDATALTITGDPTQAFDVDWEDATDPDGNEVVYVWQLATDADFNNLVFETNTGTDSEFSTDFGTVDGLLAGADLDIGAAATLYHRANAQDGSLRTTGDSKTVVLTRGSVEFDLEANLAGFNEVEPVLTSATGSATVTLVGNVLTLSGTFSDLSSAVAAAHIHVGGPDENGPVVIPLTINAATDGLSGTFETTANTYDLTTLTYPEGFDLNVVRSALVSGDAYVNVHTADVSSGEIRGQLLGDGNTAPSAVSIESPDDVAEITIEGGGSTVFKVDWEDATDPEGNEVVYVWQLAADAEFNIIVFQTNTGTESEFTADFYTIDELLIGAGVDDDASITLYHRANAQDGSLRAVGTGASVVLTRNPPLPTEEEAGLPERFAIDGNYPNPFNPSTSIRFDLPSAANVSVKVYDVIGREVMALPGQTFGAGARQELRLDAVLLSSGTYFYRVIAQMGGETEMKTGTMVLIK